MMRFGKMEGNAAPEEAAGRPHSERRTCPAHDSELSLLPAAAQYYDLFFFCLPPLLRAKIEKMKKNFCNFNKRKKTIRKSSAGA
jgi:hypothetical protein